MVIFDMGGKQSRFSPPDTATPVASALSDHLTFLPKEYHLLMATHTIAKERFTRTASVLTPRKLVAAIETDNIFLLQQLLSDDADVNFSLTSDHQAPLHVAARLGLVNMTALLLDRGADVFAQTTSGCRAIYLAAIEGRVRAFRLLLLSELGLLRSQRKGALSGKLGNNTEAACKAMLACREQAESCYVPLAHLAGDAELIDLWQTHLDATTSHHNKKIRRASKPRPETFLHLLISIGHVKAVLFLLPLGVDTEGVNNEGLRPIHLAAKRADLDILEALLESGADVNAKSSDGETAILMALDSDPDGSVVRLLLQNGADTNAMDKKGVSVLDRASRANYSGIVANILKYEPDVGQCQHRGLIFDAACHGNGKFMRGLLGKWFSPDVVRSGKMPHHLASEHGRTEALHELLVHNCRMNELAFGRKTAFELAIKSHLYDTALLLVKHGASLDYGSVNTSSKPLWLSLCSKAATSVPDDFKLTLLKSANPGVADMTMENLTEIADTADIDKDSRLGEWLEKRTSSPRGLAESCRGVIRNHMTSVHPTRSIWAPVQSLQIPIVLKSYILLES